jgi:hypothetical protein
MSSGGFLARSQFRVAIMCVFASVCLSLCRNNLKQVTKYTYSAVTLALPFALVCFIISKTERVMEEFTGNRIQISSVSVTFARNNFRCHKCLANYVQDARRYACRPSCKVFLLLYDLNQNWITSTNFSRTPKFEIS